MKNKIIAILLMSPMAAYVTYPFYQLVKIGGWWELIKILLFLSFVFISAVMFISGLTLLTGGGDKKWTKKKN